MRHCPHTYIRTALITTMTPNTSARVRWPGPPGPRPTRRPAPEEPLPGPLAAQQTPEGRGTYPTRNVPYTPAATSGALRVIFATVPPPVLKPLAQGAKGTQFQREA